MELPGQYTVVHQHKESTAGDPDRGKFFDQTLDRPVDQNLDNLVFDQSQHRLVNQV